jgi:hypothetical protein|tara:strand:+ start:6216 stop:7043 length:828 start_codon:yes stop_codon:yes gene_type:complete
MKKSIVLGNGESRKWFNHDYLDYAIANIETWGCNAIYRDGRVNNLVAMDYAMQQEIYMSGYPIHNKCWFANWNKVPIQAAEMMLLGFGISSEFVHWPMSWLAKEVNSKLECVISGKDPAILGDRVCEMMKEFPHLDIKDLKLKMEKDMGIWITPVQEKDYVEKIQGYYGWSAGNTALSLACEGGAKEIYLLGFDLSDYNLSFNNIYKGTDNYLPNSAKGFNPANWIVQMTNVFEQYRDSVFYWTDSSWESWADKFMPKNVKHIDKDEFMNKVGIF